MLEEKDVKKLIKKGFDLELISFEFDIPIDYVRKCKENMEAEEKINKEELEKSYAHNRVERLKENYRKLFIVKNSENETKIIVLSEEDKKIIDDVVLKIENEIKQIKGSSKEERRDGAKRILTQLKEIKEYNLTIEQAERIISVLESEELKFITKSLLDKIELIISHQKDMVSRKLARAIDTVQAQTEDIEELKILNAKMTSKMAQKDPMIVGTVKNRIGNKILNINQKNAMEKIRNNVSKNIENIIKDLACGKLDIESANAVIEEEAKNRVHNRPKTVFSLTEEQEKRQIFTQIRTVLTEKADKYHIKNPDITIMHVQALCGVRLEQAISDVAGNLIRGKNFESANKICDKFNRRNTEDAFYRYIIRLKKQIRSSEISDFVLRGLTSEQTPEEEMEFINSIESEIRMGNIILNEVSLGKSSDGCKNITLADIWHMENQNVK